MRRNSAGNQGRSRLLAGDGDDRFLALEGIYLKIHSAWRRRVV